MDIIQHSPIRNRCTDRVCVGKEQTMTNEEAKRRIDSIDFYLQHHTDDYSERDHDAMMMAISALENIGHLKDRPCSVCEFYKENGCCKWTCVFTDRLFGDMR